MKAVGSSTDAIHSGLSTSPRAAQRRSKNTDEYVSTASSRGTEASGGYQSYPPSTSSAPCPDCTTLTCRDTSWLSR